MFGDFSLFMVTNINSLFAAIVSVIWTVFVGIGIICILFAGLMFLTALGNAEKIKQARSAALWGVVGMVVGILGFSATSILSNVLK